MVHKEAGNTVLTARSRHQESPLSCEELVACPPSWAGSSDSQDVAAHEVSRGHKKEGAQNKTS